MIKDIIAIPSYNSRGEQTLKIWIMNKHGFYSAYAPSGKSRGKWEAKTLDAKKALKKVPKIKKRLIGMKERDYEIFDDKLEKIGGKDLKKIGANLSIALSMANIRAASDNKVYKFLNPDARHVPFPLGNVIGGGAHGGFTSIQEFLVFAPKAKDIFQAIETNFKVWNDVGKALRLKGFTAGRNDEGAWIMRKDDLKTLDFITKIAEKHGAKVGVDIAAGEFYKRGKYTYHHLKKKFNSGEQLEFVKDIIKTYKLVYVEDPFHESDFKSFSELRKKVKCLIVGDDLYATNPERIVKGIDKEAGNGVLIKPDQIGLVSRAMLTAEIAKRGGFIPVVSHRSGETEDTFISDLAVAVEAPLLKCGISGTERVAKVNRLIEIWNGIKGTKRKPQMAKLKL